jgi:hypothetical protein
MGGGLRADLRAEAKGGYASVGGFICFPASRSCVGHDSGRQGVIIPPYVEA